MVFHTVHPLRLAVSSGCVHREGNWVNRCSHNAPPGPHSHGAISPGPAKALIFGEEQSGKNIQNAHGVMFV